MKALIYLLKTTLKNNIKKALRRPITYFWILFVVIYAVIVPLGARSLIEGFNLDTPQGMVILVTVFCFWLLPANIISYSKRKGLIFKKSDTHFMFSAPINPKLILIYAHAKTLGMYMLFSIFILVAGFILFRLSVLNMLLFFVASMIFENILETSIMLLSYGSEKLTEKQRKMIVVLSYGIMISFVLIGFVVYFKQGLSLESVMYFLNCEAIQVVPIVGWYISLMQLIFLGPTLLNIICSILYVLCVVVCLIMAIKISCTGNYFEDAEKFAEDYAELKAKSQEGIATKLGKKEKYKKANVTYQGSGAKAIFYKQLLEYKKTKGFILDKTNLIIIVFGNIWIYASISELEGEPFKVFIMPLIMAYLVFCTSAMNGKWGREVKSPYTFLIPDSPIRKLWYATLMEHFKNLVYGVLFATPCAIMLKVPLIQTLLCILVYMMLQANKLYSLVMMEALVGSTLGRTGKTIFHMFLQSIPMTLAAIGVFIGIFVNSMEIAYILMTVILAACMSVFMIFSAYGFEKMETAQ